MMFLINCFLVGLLSFFVTESNAGLVSFIKPCKADDKVCIKDNAERALSYFSKGLPDLGVPVVEPIKVDSVRSDDQGLKLGFRELVISGLSKCKIIDLERNLGKSTMKLIAECPLRGIGKYDIKGKVLLLEIYGDGDFVIEGKVRITVEIKIKDIEKNGHKYWKVTGFDYSYELLDKVKIDLKNLYDGDETRAKPMLAAIDGAGNDLVQEVGGPIITQLVGNVVDVCKIFFLAVPKDELELV